ncbi:hypothetical protein AVEN_251575-1 [Araneus ventricosus]|uniref:Uncharacterized protein n=1 Tax=Araneus ventricosus TaxID=182803 RepID=A0A4Y2FE44_ARAVE|nr:hypothetical protein AVEN_251575-1 [Araneus ventricosus]
MCRCDGFEITPATPLVFITHLFYHVDMQDDDGIFVGYVCHRWRNDALSRTLDVTEGQCQTRGVRSDERKNEALAWGHFNLLKAPAREIQISIFSN